MDNRYTSGCNGYGPYSILCALRLVVVSMFVSLLDPLTAILDGVMRFIGEMTPQGAFAVAASDAGQHLEVPCKRHSPLLGPLFAGSAGDTDHHLLAEAPRARSAVPLNSPF